MVVSNPSHIDPSTFRTFFVPSENPYFEPGLSEHGDGLWNSLLQAVLDGSDSQELHTQETLTSDLQNYRKCSVLIDDVTFRSCSMSSYSFSRVSSRSAVAMAAWARSFLQTSHNLSETERTATHRVLREDWENS